MEFNDNSIELPALRSDLELVDCGMDAHPDSRWSIYDPLRNRYFRITQTSFLLLSHWSDCTLDSLKEKIAVSSQLNVSKEQVEELVRFLDLNQLILADDPNQLESLIIQKRNSEKPWYSHLIHGYLFFRIPLVKPDRFLGWLTACLKPLLHIQTLTVFLFTGVLGLILSLRQWESFTHTAAGFLTIESAACFFAGLMLTKVCHELGHGVAAKYYGCRIPTMGVAFLVMFPVLYTDTTDAWRISSRKSRLMIGVAGVLVELMIACLATLLWSFLPNGSAKSAMFMLAAVTWVTSLLINANPLMRFDGYYLLSDYWQIENLQYRAFNLARWQLRQWLFKFKESAPESFSSRDHRKLLIYAYCTWIYRFFLFLGIALLVYHFFVSIP